MERLFTEWLVRYGAPIVFLKQVFGLFGVPIPDELLLPLAGALVAKGVLDGSWTIAAAVAGCLTGITLSYVLGRVVGIAVLRRAFSRHPSHLERAQAMFRRFGGWLLAFGYFVPGVRHVTAIAAGSGCLNYSRFAAYAYPGGVLWCAVFLSLGYFAGDQWAAVAQTTRSHAAVWGAALGCAAIAATIAHFAVQRHGQRA